MKHSHKVLGNSEILERLATLYVEAEPYLGHYAWPWEEERWHEMIVCAIISAGCSPELARLSLQVLTHMQLDSPAALNQLTDRNVTTIKEVFAHSGMSAQEVDRSIAALRVAAALCMKRWGGKPQVFLRKIADSAAKDLTRELQSEGMTPSDADTLATLWLQNVISAPLLAVSSAGVKDFCLSEGITPGQLLDAADHVGLNVAVLDEVLALHHDARTANGATAEKSKINRHAPPSASKRPRKK